MKTPAAQRQGRNAFAKKEKGLKRNRILLYAVALLQGMVFYAPVSTLYRAAQGVTVFEITLIESVSLALCLLLEIPWGYLADRIGYRRAMVFCAVLYLLSKIVFWRADGFGLFLLERVMLSVVIAGLSGVDMSILYLSSEEGESQKAFGIYSAMGTVGMVLASAVYAVFIGENFRLAGGLTVVSYGLAVFAVLGLTEVKGRSPEPFHVGEAAELIRSTLRNGRLLLLLTAVALLTETHHMVTVFLNQLQYERCGMEPSLMGYVYILTTLAGVGGVLSKRMTGKLGIGGSGWLLYGGAVLCCLVLTVTEEAPVSVLSILALRVVCELFQPLQLELQNREVRTVNRATALSVNAMFVDLVGMGVDLGFGALAERSLPLAFACGALLSAVGLGLFLCFCRGKAAAR